jgi:hypothetical protein
MKKVFDVQYLEFTADHCHLAGVLDEEPYHVPFLGHQACTPTMHRTRIKISSMSYNFFSATRRDFFSHCTVATCEKPEIL